MSTARYDFTTNTVAVSLPSDLKSQAEKLGVDWNALIAAIEQYGVPLVTGVIAALTTGGIAGYLQLLPLIRQYGLPLVEAVIQALKA